MRDDIVKRLRTWAQVINETSERVRVTMVHGQLFTDASDEIERLRTLIQELRPYMEMDMNSGLSVGPGPEYHYHPDNPVKKCSDCEWYEESVAWKNRIESGELDV